MVVSQEALVDPVLACPATQLAAWQTTRQIVCLAPNYHCYVRPSQATT